MVILGTRYSEFFEYWYRVGGLSAVKKGGKRVLNRDF